MLYYTVDIASMEAELFTIRYGINKAIQTQDVSCIIVITDIIYATKKSLIPLCIHISNNQLQYLKNSEHSSASMLIIS